MPAKTGLPVASAGHGRWRRSDVVGDVQVDASVLVFAVLGLEVGYELAQGLAFFGHHVGQQQRVQQAVALRQMTLEADAADSSPPITISRSSM